MAIEEKRKKRLNDATIQTQKEIEQANKEKLSEGYSNTSSTVAILDMEDAHSKQLVDVMVNNSTTTNGPVVKVLTNVQGKKSRQYYL